MGWYWLSSLFILSPCEYLLDFTVCTEHDIKHNGATADLAVLYILLIPGTDVYKCSHAFAAVGTIKRDFFQTVHVTPKLRDNRQQLQHITIKRDVT